MKESERIIIDTLIENRLLPLELEQSQTFEEIISTIAPSIDSLTYISILVSLEEKIGKEFPDIVMSQNVFFNPSYFSEIIDLMLT